MINAMQSKNLFPLMQPFMFNKTNMLRGYSKSASLKEPQEVTDPLVPVTASLVPVPAPLVQETAPLVPAPLVPAPLVLQPTTVPIPSVKTSAKPFTPFQKDKLFWCFFILLKGYDEYEMNRSNSFSLEKKIKIETVEKLKSIKEKLKELKLKRTELEDNLVNQPTISIKGLYALCLVHNISITYIYGRKYCEINTDSTADANTIASDKKKGIIIQNEKKEDSLRWNDAADEFLNNVKENYWFIENIQKPLKAPSAYTLKELQDICQKLEIDLETKVNDKTKQKTKTKLYEEILSHI